MNYCYTRVVHSLVSGRKWSPPAPQTLDLQQQNHTAGKADRRRSGCRQWFTTLTRFSACLSPAHLHSGSTAGMLPAPVPGDHWQHLLLPVLQSTAHHGRR